jgi:peptide deformylase
VVTVRGQDQHGKKIKIRAQGWLARIFQHEIDHVNGVLYTDRASQIWKPDHEEMDTI